MSCRGGWRAALSRLWLGSLLIVLGVLCSPPPARAQGITLTPEESAWVEQHRTSIRVGVTALPPLAFRDADGDWQGLAIDVLHLLEERLGLKFELLSYPSWHALLLAAQLRQVDLLAFGAGSSEGERFLDFGQPFSVLHNKIIVRRGESNLGRLTLDDLRGKRVAVLESSLGHEQLKRHYPQLIVLPVRDERAVLTMVAFHEADAAVAEMTRATWMIESEGLTNLAVGGDTGIDFPAAVAVRNDWPVMTRLLDKAWLSVDQARRAEIARRWIRLDGQGIWDDPQARLLAAALGGSLLVAMLLVLVWNRSLRRTVAARTAELREQVRVIEMTQQELRESEDKFRNLAELTSDWFWEQDAETRFTRFFGGGLGKMALDPEQYLGRTRWETPLLGLSPAEIAAHRRLVEAHRPFRNFVYQVENRLGQRRWVTISGQPIVAADGSFLGYRGTGQDISERMADQIARIDTLERLRALLDGTFSHVCLLDAKGMLIDCNRAALRFAGLFKEDVVGRPFADTAWFAIAAERERINAAVAAAAGGEFVRYDARHAEASGAVHWLDFSLSPITDDHGMVIYLVAEGRDITDAKRAADALGNLVSTTGSVFGAAYFRRLVESLANLLVVRYVFVARLLPGQHRVRTEALWADGRIADNIEYDLAATPCDGVMSSGCCVYPRAVGKLFPQDLLLQQMGIEAYLGVPVVDSRGQPIGVLVALHDQPLVETASARQLMELFAVRVGAELERLDHEALIQELNTGLELRVEERTQQLTAANRELEAFSYSVSHDLRAPLRHIAGFVEMLEERAAEGLDDEARRYLRIIAESAARMGTLIDDLLAFSRVGRVELHRVGLDGNRLVAEVIADLAGEYRGRRVDWQVAPLPELSGDRNLLRQVWVNLLSNALKYSRDRDPAVIEVGAEVVDGVVRLYVRDNGVGFNMQYADKLFGVFQRLHRAEQFEGSGIGLANVKRIVERHGGRVWAEADEGRGATFWFTLGDGAAPAAASEGGAEPWRA